MNNFTNFNIGYYTIYSVIAMITILLNTYFLLKKDITFKSYIINSIIWILISAITLIQEGILVDELNLKGNPNLMYLLILNILIVVCFSIYIDKKRDI
ncbi:hypothetical protein CLPU_1c02700 [Gottschalkia purinilytica]|uniref:Uncharacterized protein n=1 Tax=Gottschalkia purinilytica TaxID=1503 RepID=A0A0L0WFA8_GOTPU|nr:hypothetical protein [Gottschalkia purinilytica]KNF10105.1 hypothetical protein CLPU_1c02700 [Gottschalkia purinilytica]